MYCTNVKIWKLLWSILFFWQKSLGTQGINNPGLRIFSKFMTDFKLTRRYYSLRISLCCRRKKSWTFLDCFSHEQSWVFCQKMCWAKFRWLFHCSKLFSRRWLEQDYFLYFYVYNYLYFYNKCIKLATKTNFLQIIEE